MIAAAVAAAAAGDTIDVCPGLYGIEIFFGSQNNLVLANEVRRSGGAGLHVDATSSGNAPAGTICR
jgi:hypothetical protein